MAILNLFKDGKSKVLIMSYDDGNVEGDRRLIDIFNKNGIKGTFHLCGQNYVEGGKYADMLPELRETYSGHEIAMHTYSHAQLQLLPRSEVIYQIQRDKEVLEELAGYPMRGLAYPYGTYNEQVVDILETLDVKYARTTAATSSFKLPERFTLWHPTMSHAQGIPEKLEQMLANPWRELMVLFVWGHSWAYLGDNPKCSWETLEAFCKRAGENSDKIWFATCSELYEYCEALSRIEISANRKMFRNPSAISVWICVDGEPVELKPGVTKI